MQVVYAGIWFMISVSFVEKSNLFNSLFDNLFFSQGILQVEVLQIDTSSKSVFTGGLLQTPPLGSSIGPKHLQIPLLYLGMELLRYSLNLQMLLIGTNRHLCFICVWHVPFSLHFAPIIIFASISGLEEFHQVL